MKFTEAQLTFFMEALASGGGLGLIVADEIPMLPKVKAVVSRLAVEAPSEVLEALRRVAEKGEWLELDVRDANFPHEVYNVLRQISSVQRFDVRDVATGELVSVRWPKSCAVIVMVSASALESVAIPNFLELFGPVLRGK
ncbi:MAG: hypothetical protein WCJ29_06450 [bacterium]